MDTLSKKGFRGDQNQENPTTSALIKAKCEYVEIEKSIVSLNAKIKKGYEIVAQGGKSKPPIYILRKEREELINRKVQIALDLRALRKSRKKYRFAVYGDGYGERNDE